MVEQHDQPTVEDDEDDEDEDDDDDKDDDEEVEGKFTMKVYPRCFLSSYFSVGLLTYCLIFLIKS